MAGNKNETIKAALVLFAITLFAGVCLAAVHAVTAEPIAAQKEKKQQAAYQAVLPAADRFESSEQLDALVENQEDILAGSQVDLRTAVIEAAVIGYDADGNTCGYVVNALTSSGYGGDIELSIGFDTEGVVTGVEILDINETAGLGMNAKKDTFRSQYVGHAVAYFTVTKSGKQADNEIDAISSATITSKAVTDAVNAALLFVNSGVKEAAL